MPREFQAFATRGNVVDLATDLTIGVAFGNIVTSLVNDILMPPTRLLIDWVDFIDVVVNLSGQAYAMLAEARATGAPTLNDSIFLNPVIDFVIVAFAIFVVVRFIHRLHQAPPPPTRARAYSISVSPLNASRCPRVRLKCRQDEANGDHGGPPTSANRQWASSPGSDADTRVHTPLGAPCDPHREPASGGSSAGCRPAPQRSGHKGAAS